MTPEKIDAMQVGEDEAGRSTKKNSLAVPDRSNLEDNVIKFVKIR